MDQSEVLVQAVGASVEYAINLALDVQEKYSNISTEVETFSMPVTDDLVDAKTGEQVSK